MTATGLVEAQRHAREAEARAQKAEEALDRILEALERVREATREGVAGRGEGLDVLSERLESLEALVAASTAEARGGLAAQEARVREVMTRLADVELSILDGLARLRREVST